MSISFESEIQLCVYQFLCLLQRIILIFNKKSQIQTLKLCNYFCDIAFDLISDYFT